MYKPANTTIRIDARFREIFHIPSLLSSSYRGDKTPSSPPTNFKRLPLNSTRLPELYLNNVYAGIHGGAIHRKSSPEKERSARRCQWASLALRFGRLPSSWRPKKDYYLESYLLAGSGAIKLHLSFNLRHEFRGRSASILYDAPVPSCYRVELGISIIKSRRPISVLSHSMR